VVDETVITAACPVVDRTGVAADGEHAAAVPEIHTEVWQASLPIRADNVKSVLPKLIPHIDSFPPGDEGVFAKLPNGANPVIVGASNEKIGADVPTKALQTVVAVLIEAPAPDIDPQMRVVQEIQDDVEQRVLPICMDRVRSPVPRLQPCMLRDSEAPLVPALAGQLFVMAGVS
jgi:hypothetical protein